MSYYISFRLSAISTKILCLVFKIRFKKGRIKNIPPFVRNFCRIYIRLSPSSLSNFLGAPLIQILILIIWELMYHVFFLIYFKLPQVYWKLLAPLARGLFGRSHLRIFLQTACLFSLFGGKKMHRCHTAKC